MVRKFNGNNFMKGRIEWQLATFIGNGITFEKGTKRNTCIIVVDESKIDTTNLKYLCGTLIPKGREITGA
jgi:hypothetical protein